MELRLVMDKQTNTGQQQYITALAHGRADKNKKRSYCREIARRAMLAEMLPTAL